MLSSYREVLSRPGTLSFSATGLVARLPIAMLGLGIVLLVSSATGSYALAGSVSAVYVLANAVVAVVQGRLVDRLGQSRVLPVAISVYAGALGVLMAAVQLGWPVAVVFAGAAVSGAALPQVGACVRARWSHVLDEPSQVQTAYALEAVADEAVFIVGPVVVTVLATAVHPLAGLGVALVVGLAGTLALTAQRSTEPPAHPRPVHRSSRPRMPWPVVAALTAVMVSMGGIFGATEVVTVAFTEERDAASLAGALLALWATGSLVAGVVTGAVHWRRGPAQRLTLGAAGMAVTMALLPFVGTVPVMGVVLLLGGFAISPTLIAALSLVEQVAPPARLTEAMGVLHTGLAGGVALGAAAAGSVVDARGASAAYLVPVVAGVLATAAAQVTWIAVRRG
jgi:MFS family permease